HLERIVGRVDAMGLAVEQRYPDVDHRIASADALFHLRAHALLVAGYEVALHRSAEHLVDDLDVGALRQRLRYGSIYRGIAFTIAQRSPATTAGAGRCCLPSVNDSVPMRSASSWSMWPAMDPESAWVAAEERNPSDPKNDEKWPDT